MPSKQIFLAVPGVTLLGGLVAAVGPPKMMAVHPLRTSAAMSPTVGSVSLPAFMESSYHGHSNGLTVVVLRVDAAKLDDATRAMETL